MNGRAPADWQSAKQQTRLSALQALAALGGIRFKARRKAAESSGVATRAAKRGAPGTRKNENQNPSAMRTAIKQNQSNSGGFRLIAVLVIAVTRE